MVYCLHADEHTHKDINKAMLLGGESHDNKMREILACLAPCKVVGRIAILCMEHIKLLR
jgi:hypothetical protein